MIRNAALVLAVVLVPPLLEAQEPAQQARSHTVVRGETLWELARVYYGNPFDWRTIYEANTDKIANPHWIYPGQVFTIPGTSAVGVVTDVTVQTTPVPFAVGPGQEPPSRTVFYGDPASRITGTEVVGSTKRTLLAVPPDIFYSAGWLVPDEDIPDHLGVVAGWAAGHDPRSRRTTAGAYEPLRLALTGLDVPEVGDHLLTFRVTRAIEGVGRVAHPTGMLTVSRIESGGVVAVVVNEYDRVQLDDYVTQADPFPLEPGVRPSPTSDPIPATIVGFQEIHELPSLGDVAFLDRGAREGVSVGDEFVAIVGGDPGWSGAVAGRLQVVGTRGRFSAARIVAVTVPVFSPGLQVRLDRKMP